MDALQDIGRALTELPAAKLKKMNLDDGLLVALLDFQKITANGAKRRQLQYIGKLMRSVDEEPIRAGLALLRGESAAEVARIHRLERFRTRLLEDENTLTEIGNQWPGVDLQYLRQLRRNALKEQEQNKPPKSYRAIFQFLKELDGTPPATEATHDDE